VASQASPETDLHTPPSSSLSLSLLHTLPLLHQKSREAHLRQIFLFCPPTKTTLPLSPFLLCFQRRWRHKGEVYQPKHLVTALSLSLTHTHTRPSHRLKKKDILEPVPHSPRHAHHANLCSSQTGIVSSLPIFGLFPSWLPPRGVQNVGTWWRNRERPHSKRGGRRPS
jgi:hypothetical protein